MEEGTVHSDLVFRQGVHIEKNLTQGSLNQRVWRNEPHPVQFKLSQVFISYFEYIHNRIIVSLKL